MKPEHVVKAKAVFPNTGVQITEEGVTDTDETSREGQRYLGSALGTPTFIKNYAAKKIDTWVSELEGLCEIAKTEPQLAYAAYTFGLCKRWMYLMRTVPGISQLFAPLEACIRSKFLPALLVNYQFNDLDRELCSLPAKHGGLGIFNPVEVCDFEYI